MSATQLYLVFFFFFFCLSFKLFDKNIHIKNVCIDMVFFFFLVTSKGNVILAVTKKPQNNAQLNDDIRY